MSTDSFSNWQSSLTYNLCISGVTVVPERSNRSVMPVPVAMLEADAFPDDDINPLTFMSCCR